MKRMSEVEQAIGRERMDEAWRNIISLLTAYPHIELKEILEALSGDEHEVVVAFVGDCLELWEE